MNSTVFHSDTIAAIATSLSDSGIGIIRVSGEDAISIVDKICVIGNGRKRLTDVNSHTIHYGHIVRKTSTNHDEIIDEVMISVMKGPRSYTAEDTVEINCHGGVLIVQKVLEEVLKAGARLAEPGEFTKRAFLNGRIDLSKAEAVIDIIHAKNEYALDASVKQLKGSLSDRVRDLRADIIYEIAFIESALDDPEHISLDGYPDELMAKTDKIIAELERLKNSADNGKIIKEGIHTVIVGKPNAGKSSLLNLLVGEEKAIVTNIAGTTRDILEENIKLHGIGLNIIDTAGIRSTEDVVEKIGVEKAKRYAEQADLILYVVDSSVPLDESDEQIMEMIQNKKCIILLNKSDLENVVSEEDLRNILIKKNCINSRNDIYGKDFVILKTSTKENTGIEIFEQTLKDMFFNGKIQLNGEVCITNMRHKAAIMDALDSMKMVKQSLIDDMPEDFYSIDLMSAYASLGKIIGEEVDDDLVNEIFSKFCMGK